jgi:hypothetical protein
VGYFHVVFTLPHELSALTLQNKTEIYRLLLQASADTLLEVAANPKHLGAAIGFLSILHTWGQNLLHPATSTSRKTIHRITFSFAPSAMRMPISFFLRVTV